MLVLFSAKAVLAQTGINWSAARAIPLRQMVFTLPALSLMLLGKKKNPESELVNDLKAF